MEQKQLLPFNAVDIFAYLGNGFIFSLGAYLLVKTYRAHEITSQIVVSKSLQREWVLVPLAFFVSYIVGHLLAHLSYPLYDRALVGRFFGAPGDHALALKISGSVDVTHKSLLRSWILLALGTPLYERALPIETRRRIEETPLLKGVAVSSTAQHYSIRSMFTVVNESLPRTSSRIATFLNIYSFCRNSSFSFLVLGILALIVGGRHELGIAAGCFVMAWVLLGRYLMFLKFYTDEIYLGYVAYISHPKLSAQPQLTLDTSEAS